LKNGKHEYKFVWLRTIGDTIFGIGALALGWFILGLKTGWSIEDNTNEIEASNCSNKSHKNQLMSLE
jgi:hypothetical protein